jgi:predicted Zn-dependent peptidase
MSYITKEIKQGIKIHLIQTDKFKTNLIGVFITTPLKRENVTFNALIPAILKRGTQNLKTQEEISKKLENMYGTILDCGIEKTGDNHIIKFYTESLNNKFVPKNEKQNLNEEAVKIILDVIFNPLLEQNKFKKEYVDSEKNNIKILIKSKIDNKDQYAYNRCIEEMYKDKPYGLYKYGYEKDLDKINETNLYEYYLELINTAKIDIFVSGDFTEEEIIKIIENNENIKKLKERENKTIINNEETEIKEDVEIKTIQEKMDVNQGKIVIGLDIHYNKKDSKFAMCMYNVILGESATSKMFQNVREKASLAYSARSNYTRQKNNIFIRCGIEIKNYEKAIEIIKEQLEDMKQGKFTEEDIENAKKYMISGLESIPDEQDSEITYYFGQELSSKLININEYINKIKAVQKEDIKNIAKAIKINTIYFLRN